MAFLAGCTGDIADAGEEDNPVGPGDTEDPGDPDVCIPGIPTTTQLPRLLNREYDAVVKDLLGVEGLASEGNNPPSALLVPDQEGSLNDIAWNSYLVAAERVAAEVMAGPNKSRFISCDPAAAGCLETTIRTFGRKAFRRPVTDEEVQRFMRLATLEPQGTPAEIAEAILYAFLASPSFLMLPELAEDKEGGAYKLSNHEVATRLSFLLWDSVPDDELNAAADAGQLTTKEQILAQAQRMIGNREKTAPLVATFHRVYADIRPGAHWATLEHDTTKYPEYSPDVVAPMMAEIDAFFEEVTFQGGSFKDIFLSNVAYVNKDTAPLYGLKAADYGTELTRVELDPNERPGFLTRVGFLSSYSSYASTSPILRGAFITTKLLGVPLQPAPGAEETPLPEGNFTTQRQVIEALTSPGGCVECHSAMVNPPGFVLERFDSIGKVQTVDPLGGQLDTTGDVFFGENNIKKITTPAELMTELGAGPVAKRHYAEQWVAFATGRTPNSKDACVVDGLNAKLSNDGYTIVNLLADLTQADSFRLRVRGN
ncbi:DUF1592 domain-containing protein [Sorangium cellulosum]|uniref:DUF1592 domain-containing protein n=1 Tax=Sorangium cellulosum TaxID=56 RepID=UPI001F2F8240|nr:DUF1592 domain-containing protein [Sorangium cellulosum]